MSWLLKARRSPEGSRAIVAGTLLLAAATVFRVLPSVVPGPWLEIAAGCWSAAFLLLCALFAFSPARQEKAERIPGS
jgi:uncharacterized protein involved in response to NO